MQNAPAMLAQRMMNRQAPYGPVGMVSQNMSGNKKSGGVSSVYMSVNASVSPIAVGSYDVYIFNASGTFSVLALGTNPAEGNKIEYLVIAGGGGSTTQFEGGAGAGGYKTASGLVVTAQTYAITVGGGGSNTVGVNSSIGTAVISNGGGAAGFAVKNGGSGAGAYRDTTNNIAAGTGIAGQGFAGGSVTFTGGATAFSTGGGGGAGGLGGNGSITVGGNGGAGLTSSITGSAVARGGGGAAYSFDGVTYNFGTSTAGGGGPSDQNGTANTGGGGSSSGAGGSGVIIIKVRARA